MLGVYSGFFFFTICRGGVDIQKYNCENLECRDLKSNSEDIAV